MARYWELRMRLISLMWVIRMKSFFQNFRKIKSNRYLKSNMIKVSTKIFSHKWTNLIITLIGTYFVESVPGNYEECTEED
jgi:hypothetical protein